MRSVASSGAKERSSQATPSSFAAATADTAKVVSRIAVSRCGSGPACHPARDKAAARHRR
jgi:hypothetical protein